MAKIKVRRERTVHIRPHNDLRQAAVHHKKRAEERFANGDLKGIAYDTLAAMVLLAFAVEAQVNFLGHQLIPGWKERAPLDTKMKEVLVTERSNAATEERLKSGHAVGGVSIV